MWIITEGKCVNFSLILLGLQEVKLPKLSAPWKKYLEQQKVLKKTCVKKRSCQYLIFTFMSLSPEWLTHRENSGKVHRLFVTLSYFQPDRFAQLLSLKPILIFLFHLLVSTDLVYTGICEVRYQKLY